MVPRITLFMATLICFLGFGIGHVTANDNIIPNLRRERKEVQFYEAETSSSMQYSLEQESSSAETIENQIARLIIGEWQLPVENPVLSSVTKNHVNPPYRKSVPAWDFTVPYGTKIYPVKPGKTKYAGCNNAGGYGCWVWLDHGGGWESVYCHMIQGSIQVQEGQSVTRDTVLGKVGWTGVTSFGPHVHLEIRYRGRQVDPETIYGSPAEIGLPYKKLYSVPIQ